MLNRGMLAQVAFLAALLLSNSLFAFEMDWVLSHSAIAENPILVQTIKNNTQENIADHYLMRAFQVAYSTDSAKPQLSRLWSHEVPKQSSTLVLIGAPDFPFPDRWPWQEGLRFPPENQASAQTYSDFKHHLSNRTALVYQIVYQLDSGYRLQGRSPSTGETEVDLDLTAMLEIESGLASDIASGIAPFDSRPEPLLTTMDVFFDNHWKTVLVGIVGKQTQVAFALDVTNPHVLASADAASTLIWKVDDKLSNLTQASIVRMRDQHWYVLLAGTVDTEYSRIEAIAIDTGKAGYQRTFDGFAIGHLTAIDGLGGGYVDQLILTDTQGVIRWLTLEHNQSDHHDLNIVQKVNRNILSQPRITRHMDCGWNIVFTSQEKDTGSNYLHHTRYVPFTACKLNEAQQTIKSWHMPIAQQEPDVLIHSQRVLGVSNTGMLEVRDVHNGKVYQQAVLKNLYSDDPVPAHSVIGKAIVLQQRAKQPDIVLQALQDHDIAWALLDIESDHVGRRTWRELQS